MPCSITRVHLDTLGPTKTKIQLDRLGPTDEIPVVTCGEMKALEKAADEAGLSYYQMMENAGTCAASFIEDVIREETTRLVDLASPISSLRDSASPICSLADLASPIYDAAQVLVFCGKGNNGGDGLVVARLLANHGFRVSVILVEGNPTTRDSITNFGLLPEKVTLIHYGDETPKPDEKDPQANNAGLSLSRFMPSQQEGAPPPLTIVVDGIYGTGFHGTLRPEISALIKCLNQHSDPSSKKLTFALDLPSGLSGDMGAPDELREAELAAAAASEAFCVDADYTISFHGLKPIHLNPAAQPYLGQLVLADIGITDVLK